MMGSNDDLQSNAELTFAIDWARWRNMVAGSIEDLCALSVGVDPESLFARFLFVTAPLLSFRQKETAYENIVEWIKRVRVAKHHVGKRTPSAGVRPNESLPGRVWHGRYVDHDPKQKRRPWAHQEAAQSIA
jgi:hypothetical protein